MTTVETISESTQALEQKLPVLTTSDHPSVLSFLCAFTVYMTLLTGSLTLAWSMILNNAWMGLTGFLIALVGCALFGRSHSQY